MKHIARFHWNEGMAPQIAVPTNMIAARRMEARRPNTSASTPQTREPATVPVRAVKGSMATAALVRPYSLATPGATKPRVAGFMVSMIRAKASTIMSMIWAPLSFTASSVSTTRSWPLARPLEGGGKSPKPAVIVPRMIRPMPACMPRSICMPAIS